MNNQVSKILGLIVGSFGAVGQSWLLLHELTDRYPYKVMSAPPAEFYSQTGHASFFLAPVIAIVAGTALAFQRAWAGFIVPVVICPLVYALIFLVRDFGWNGPVARNFDGTTQSQVTTDFVIYTVELSIAGAVVGFLAWAVWSRLLERSRFG